MVSYDFGPSHPLAPVRVALTVSLAEALGVLSLPSVSVVAPSAATDDELLLVHTPEYIAAVRQAGAGGRGNGWDGLGTADNPVFPGMHEASALIAGGTLAGGRGGGGCSRGGPGSAWRECGRRPASRDGAAGQRILHLQRPGYRHLVAAVGRCVAGGLRGTRRAP